MKKSKLLTSIVSLALVLSLGACSETEDSEVLTSESTSTNTSGYVKEELTGPAAFIDDACTAGNYSITLIVDEWVSESISEDDYTNKNYDIDALEDSMTCTRYLINAYYTENALLVEYYQVEEDSLTLIEKDLNVNSLYYGFMPATDLYFTLDDETWYYYGTYYDYYQDSYYTLFDNSWIELGNSDFTLIYSGYDEEGDLEEVYNFTTSNAMYYFSAFIGSDLWNYSWLYYGLGYLYYFDYIYLYPELGEMYSSYYGSMWFYTDDEEENVQIIEDDFYTRYYNIGNTNISDIVAKVEEAAINYK